VPWLKIRKKLLNLKLDGLQKHVGKEKALTPHPRILVGDYYISNDNQHQRKEMKGFMLTKVHILL
jgi:hypothetical protein